MKNRKILFFTLMNLLVLTSAAFAGDFDWVKDFNISAQADPSGFRAGLETRFKVGDLEVNAVLGDVTNPSDAYMLFRLGEMSGKPIEYVREQYRVQKGKGWGVLAKSLGIKPGSGDFHELKRGQDLYSDKHSGQSNTNHKGNNSKKGKGRK